MANNARYILQDPRYQEFRIRYFDNFELYMLENADVDPTWQQLKFVKAVQEPGARVAVASGHGCFGKGTPVLMFDGTIKPVEDVEEGDLLMGDDSTPRTVLRLRRGQENMYRFTYMDGISHVFNESHILCLVATQTHGRQTTGDKTTPLVRDYLTWSERKRRTNAAYRSGCDFQAQDKELPIPPYILGLWLGDGTNCCPEICNPEPEVREEIFEYAKNCGYGITIDREYHYFFTNHKRHYGFLYKLKQLGLYKNKHIPHAYKTASREGRLELLAGLLDTDGFLYNNGGAYEITQKSENLAKDILYLVKSLGMHATLKPVRKKCYNTGVIGDYFRIHISRNIEQIPMRVARKKPNMGIVKQRPNLHFGIRSVESLGMGDYYGFELDGNHKFLSGDFTVLHNTGKSHLLAWLLDWNMRVFPFSNAILTATNIEQARSVVWKYLDGVIERMEYIYPWMRGMFVKETRRYYARGFKDSWYVLPKTASKSAPENLAGQHNDNLLVIVDEASGVDDAIHEVLRGALTHRRNRYVMTSQPTRPSGHFADAMRTLSKENANGGIYDAITMNSEESPLVSHDFIKEKLYEYGGHHSPEYQVRVLGRFPDNMAGYLIPRTWVEDCQNFEIEMPDGDWGYVLLCDVAEGVHRDSSVATLVRMSGHDDKRLVETVFSEEFLDMNEKEFARFIASKYQELPNLTIAVDGDGAGRAVILDLEEVGIPVTQIHWGLPCHTQTAQRRYANLRAFAHCKLREAIFEKRFKGPNSRKFVDQASRLPYKLDERGRYTMTSKDKMRSEGIKSPDISDTCCFSFLVDYIPADAGRKATRSSKYLDLAREWMAAEEASTNGNTK